MKGFRFSRKQLCIPYALFLICFVVLPLAVIVVEDAVAKQKALITQANNLSDPEKQALNNQVDEAAILLMFSLG